MGNPRFESIGEEREGILDMMDDEAKLDNESDAEVML